MIGDRAEILIIDDDPGMRTTLVDIFEDDGYRIEACSNGKEALKLLKKSSFDIVVVDIKLPDISGVELLEPAREMNPEAAVIMMTGYATIETAVDTMKQGAYAYIIKPFNIEELKAIVKKALKSIRLALENKRLIDDLQRSNIELERMNLRLKEIDHMKTSFLANMSHELRTPLNSIIGFSEALSDKLVGDVNEKQERYLQNIYTSGKILLQLIDDILDLSKIEAGKIALNFEEFSLKSLLESVTRIIHPSIQKKQLNLLLKVSENLLRIKADRAKLEQIILNLMSNAVKFTPEQGQIRVEAEYKYGGFQISVIDTGIGIAKQDQEIIFNEFKQVDGSVSKKYKGTGLGLAITKKLIELHGGKIWVESQPDKGSKFTFIIPKNRKQEAKDG